MKASRRIRSAVLALALFLSLWTPMPAQAANLYFTAINDSIPPLTADTMPFWSGGSIYVPYTVFDANLNGINVSLGLYTNYNRGNNTITIFNLRQMLVFDLNNGTCRDDMTGTVYSSRSIVRNGRRYLSLSMVCSFFGLEYSYNQLPNIPQGYLVRIKSADAVLDDALFIERAKDLINSRLREYTMSLSPAESTDQTGTPPTTTAPPSSQTPAVDGNDTPAYLAFRCESGESFSAILDILDSSHHYGVFFLAPQVMEEEGDLIRRALGTGHSVGVLTDGGEETNAQLVRGRWALEAAAHTRTTLAYAPANQRGALEQDGWVCWKETLLLSPGDTVGATAFANSVLGRLGKRQGAVYLTLEGNTNTVRVLSTLLRQLSNNHYNIAVPMETRL